MGVPTVLLLSVLCAIYFCAAAPGKWFDHIFIVQFENHAYDEVVNDPNFSKYRALGTIFTDYYAITHPSQPNYWCQVAGDHFGYTTDSSVDLPHTSIVDLFDAQGVTWKGYDEDLPGLCYTGTSSGKYYRKHNPFISFNNIRTNATRCARIVDSSVLDTDLAQGTLPQYSYFTPNIDDDAHDTSVAYGGVWLNGFFTPRISKFPPKTLFVITWDEDDYTESNRIDTFVWGSMIRPGGIDNTSYNHYSLLRTVEDNWALGNLGRNDATATPFNFATDYNTTPRH